MATRSRLTRKEEARSLRRAFFYLVLTVGFVTLLAIWGVPSLVRVATFFSQWRGASTPIGKTDFLPPAPPNINLIPRATKKDLLSLSGTAEPGSTVDIFLNEEVKSSVVANNEGVFILDSISLSEGENQIYAIATDQAGNSSSPSRKLAILYDAKPPELEISSPEDGATLTGQEQKRLTVSGKTEPGISLTINGRLTILDQEGNFSSTFSLTEGENTFKIIALDLAENQTEKEIKVTYTP